MKKKGLVILYTGNGKGKTTAALGQALRAVGHGFNVCIVQFIKKDKDTGEVKALLRMNDQVEIHTTGSGFVWKDGEVEKHSQAALAGWELAREKIMSDLFDMVILDELTYPLNFEYLNEQEVLSTIRSRPTGQDIIITGREASQRIIDEADLVTEMKEVKHPFKSGVKARKGIEF